MIRPENLLTIFAVVIVKGNSYIIERWVFYVYSDGLGAPSNWHIDGCWNIDADRGIGDLDIVVFGNSIIGEHLLRF